MSIMSRVRSSHVKLMKEMFTRVNVANVHDVFVGEVLARRTASERQHES